jgi:hypothetical protein
MFRQTRHEGPDGPRTLLVLKEMKNLICPFAASRLMLNANPSLALPFTLATVMPKTVSFTPAVKVLALK